MKIIKKIKDAFRARQESLRNIITGAFLKIIIVALVVVGLLAAAMSYVSTIQALKITMTSAVQTAASKITISNAATGAVLNNIMKDIEFTEHTNAYVLDPSGTIIAAADPAYAGARNNIIERAKTDKSLKNRAKTHEAALKGEPGLTMTTYGGVQLVSYAPIDGRDWVVVIESPTADFLQFTYIGGITLIFLIIFTVILSMARTRRLAAKIAAPISKAGARLEQLAQGDLASSVDASKGHDEANMILQNLSVTITALQNMVSNITEHLIYMADGDFTHQYTAQSAGDFRKIDQALVTITDSFRNTLEQISQASRDVASGADQMASGAQMLADGATTQAASLENVVMSMDNISGQVDASASNTEQIAKRINELHTEVTGSNEKMETMLSAMGDIRNKSRQIGDIIKAIDEIAFQTNILALNAAVEAARAGAAGAGFNVVADEVRSLALKCAEAAKNTAQLIKDSMSAVDNGTELAQATADSLMTVVANTEEVANLVSEIASATAEQAKSMNEIKGGVSHVSDVVQSNSATAEESAATSEELAGQAVMLNSLLKNFKFE